MEDLVDASGVARTIEALLPVGVRPRQLCVRSLLIGIVAAAGDGRPAHLCRAHAALLALDPDDQARLGVIAEWRCGPHVLTYRQVEYTFGVVAAALAKDSPDGAASESLAQVLDHLVEASIPAAHKAASRSLAVDWTDHETWALAPHSDGATYDPEASWGHRRSHAIGERDELFYGYYLSAATMIADDAGPPVAELIRRITLSTCHLDPVAAMVPVLRRLAESGVALGDVVADAGYANRQAAHWALPLRALGAQIVTDLHPADRGPKGTFAGAICANGELYCPATPTALLALTPLSRGADAESAAAQRSLTDAAAAWRLGRHGGTDADGYYRATCPALAGKLRCPQRPQTMALPYDRPEVLDPPKHRPCCCSQKTITVPPVVNAKTRQKHPYPSAPWAASYNRRSAAERANATLKDPAATNIGRGWCRLAGLSAITLVLACTIAARNLRITHAFQDRQTQDAARAARGLAPRTRRPRRRPLAQLAAAAKPPP